MRQKRIMTDKTKKFKNEIVIAEVDKRYYLVGELLIVGILTFVGSLILLLITGKNEFLLMTIFGILAFAAGILPAYCIFRKPLIGLCDDELILRFGKEKRVLIKNLIAAKKQTKQISENNKVECILIETSEGEQLEGKHCKNIDEVVERLNKLIKHEEVKN
jgi:hypothetical protein